MKDARGHGSNAGPRRPIPGHPYHSKSDMELRYIQKDAHEAGRNAQEMGDQKGINKYADQVNDASTVLAYRRSGGKSDAPADALHSGTSKSDPAPVHDSMAGSARRTSRNGWEVEHGGQRKYFGSRANAVEYRQAALDKGHSNVTITDPRGNITHS